jgi:hypothetical protein
VKPPISKQDKKARAHIPFTTGCETPDKRLEKTVSEKTVKDAYVIAVVTLPIEETIPQNKAVKAVVKPLRTCKTEKDVVTTPATGTAVHKPRVAPPTRVIVCDSKNEVIRLVTSRIPIAVVRKLTGALTDWETTLKSASSTLAGLTLKSPSRLNSSIPISLRIDTVSSSSSDKRLSKSNSSLYWSTLLSIAKAVRTSNGSNENIIIIRSINFLIFNVLTLIYMKQITDSSLIFLLFSGNVQK